MLAEEPLECGSLLPFYKAQACLCFDCVMYRFLIIVSPIDASQAPGKVGCVGCLFTDDENI
jgi:hypothetical protein